MGALTLAWWVPAAGQQRIESDTIVVQLDEVIVTGSRTGGEILSLPLAVGVVEGKDFLMSRQSGLPDALWGMPGVLAQSRSGSSDVRLTVRGFGARGNGDRSNAGTVRGIKILLDGFPETEPDGRTSLDLVDLSSTERIEVLRSNASSLFGNASGGVVNIQTDRAVSAPEFGLAFLAGDFGLRTMSIGAGSGFGSSHAWFRGSGSDFDGWRENSSSRRRLFNLIVNSDLGDSTSLRVLAAAAENRYFIPGPLTEEEFNSQPTMANPTYEARKERRENTVGRFGASFGKWWKEHSVELLGYYSPKLLTRSERGTYRNFNRYHVGGGATYTWTPSDLPVRPRVVAGLDEAYQDGTILFYSLVDGERGDSLRTNKREGANTLGAFAQLTIEPVPGLSLIGGARWDQQSYLSEVYPAGSKESGSKDELLLSHVTPRFGLVYRYAPNHSFYVHVGGGLEAPAFNEVDPPPELPEADLNPFLKPMSSVTYEAGFKGVDVFGQGSWIRSLSYALALYTIAIENEIVPYDGGSWYLSAGRSRRNGIEAEANVDFSYGISLKASLTLLEATYLEYSNELGDFSGNEVPGIPPVVASGRVRYRSPFALAAEVGVEYISDYVADDAGQASVPSYVLVGGALSYGITRGGLEVSAQLGVQNLFDAHYAGSAYINPSSRTDAYGKSVPVYLEPGLPRNLFGGLSVEIVL
jgi:iron complex outermembrane recepter protein